MNSLYSLLSPLQVFLHLLGSFHAIRKVHASTSQSSLSERLQFEEFAVLCIQFARSEYNVSYTTLVRPR